MDEKQIESIVRRVLDNISFDLEKNKLPTKKREILGLGFGQEEKNRLEQMESYQFQFEQKLPEICEYREIWIGNLDVEDISSLSMGLETSYGKILSQLLQGKTIKIFFPSFDSYKGNSYLIEQVKKKIETLEKMGFELENLEEIRGRSHKVSPVNNSEKPKNFPHEIMEFSDNPVRFRIEKKVIAEKDLIELPRTVNVLEVATTTVVTPLAKDILKEKDIMLVHLF